MKRFMENLRQLQIEYGFGESRRISDEEKEKYEKLIQEGAELPRNVFRTYINNRETFQKVVQYDISMEEKIEYLMLKQTSCIQIIKYCIICITVIVLVCFFALGISLL